jgi:hypothetical protein
VAAIDISDDTVAVRLGAWEKVGALRGDVVVPRRAVRSARTSERGWREVRGVRAPGAGFPGVISLGTYRRRGRKDFAAVYGRSGHPVVVVELDPGAAPFARLLVSTPDADEVVRRLGAPAG